MEIFIYIFLLSLKRTQTNGFNKLLDNMINNV